MARREVDAVCVGVGWTGGILAAELTKAGMSVVGLERGQERGPEDAMHGLHDELRYGIRHELMQDTALETWTLRHNLRERALPLRRLGSFKPGTGLGGAGVHWGAVTWRFHPRDLEMRSKTIERYGRSKIPEDMTIQDWGITWDELEPYYDRFEYMVGVSGKAGNLKGEKQDGGNPFEGPRSREYPLEPLMKFQRGEIFRKAATELGYHCFPGPAATLSKGYENPAGISRQGCNYCGYSADYVCDVQAKGDPTVTVIPEAMETGRFDLRTNANVVEIVHDGKRARGVRYYDETGRLQEQRAEIVLLTAYVFNNCRLLLVSDMGEPYDPRTGNGAIGKNYCYQAGGAGAQVFLTDKDFKPYMGACGNSVAFDDLNADNFDHKDLDFIGGGSVTCGQSGSKAIDGLNVPEDTPAWGPEWKQAIRRYYGRSLSFGAQGESPAYRGHFLDLDRTYRDAMGLPLLRITFDWEPNERKMVAYLGRKLREIADRVDANEGAEVVAGGPGELPERYDVVPYQSTHNTGGVIMGSSPRDSAVNNYLQMWDFPNVFVVGASAFPQNAGFNPTGTVGALAYRAADGIVNKYAKDPGPLA